MLFRWERFPKCGDEERGLRPHFPCLPARARPFPFPSQSISAFLLLWSNIIGARRRVLSCTALQKRSNSAMPCSRLSLSLSGYSSLLPPTIPELLRQIGPNPCGPARLTPILRPLSLSPGSLPLSLPLPGVRNSGRRPTRRRREATRRDELRKLSPDRYAAQTARPTMRTKPTTSGRSLDPMDHYMYGR